MLPFVMKTFGLFLLMIYLYSFCFAQKDFSYPVDIDGEPLTYFEQYTSFRKAFGLASPQKTRDSLHICIATFDYFIELRFKGNGRCEGKVISSACADASVSSNPIAYYLQFPLSDDTVRTVWDSLQEIQRIAPPEGIPKWHYHHGRNADLSIPHRDLVIEVGTPDSYSFKRYESYTGQGCSFPEALIIRTFSLFIYDYLSLFERQDLLISVLPPGYYYRIPFDQEITEKSMVELDKGLKLRKTRKYRNRDDF